jgi:hypothetical protein
MIESSVDSRMNRFGGGAALVLAVLTALAGIAYVLLPAEQRLGVPGRQLLPSFAANPLPLQLEMGLLALMGIVGLGVVRPIRRLLSADDPWLRWASTLAIVGYAIGAVGNSLVMGKLPGIAGAFVAADDAGKTVIAVFLRTTLDPWGLWQFGAVGGWLLIVGYVAWRSRALPPMGAYLAIAAGVAHIVFPVLLVLSAGSAVTIAAIVASVVMLAWFAWVGLLLWRRADIAPAG